MFTLTTTLNLTVYRRKLKEKKVHMKRNLHVNLTTSLDLTIFHRLGQYSVIISQYQ